MRTQRTRDNQSILTAKCMTRLSDKQRLPRQCTSLRMAKASLDTELFAAKCTLRKNLLQLSPTSLRYRLSNCRKHKRPTANCHGKTTRLPALTSPNTHFHSGDCCMWNLVSTRTYNNASGVHMAHLSATLADYSSVGPVLIYTATGSTTSSTRPTSFHKLTSTCFHYEPILANCSPCEPFSLRICIQRKRQTA